MCDQPHDRPARVWSSPDRPRLGTSAHHQRVQAQAIVDQARIGLHEGFERRVDVVEMDVREEAVGAGIDAVRGTAEQKSLVAEQVRHDLQVGLPARVRLVRLVAADALVVVALGVVVLGLLQRLGGQLRWLSVRASQNSGQKRSSCQRD